MSSDKMVRDKIAEIGSLPDGIRFDKAAAWGKLEGRMKKKKVVALLYIRWAAAAVLLVMIGIGLYQHNSPKNGIALKQPLQLPVNKPMLRNKQHITETNKPGSVLPTEKLLVRRPRGNVTYQQRRRNDTTSTPIVAQVAATKPIDTMQPAPVKTNTIVAVKKVMKTVHINELNDDNGEEIQQKQKEYLVVSKPKILRGQHNRSNENEAAANHETIMNYILNSEN